jgi:bifunctional non-homologous end joining protein LigD
VPLEDYRRKRDPGLTPEPFGDGAPVNGPRFVVQRHAARRLHYDLRLERDGVLASWAVPKGMPMTGSERHLAVHVEDHPLAYADFEGEIPAGQYGAGTVEIWDRGTYELVEEKKDGGLTVRLHGERLEGVWTLVPARLDGDARNWLLLRKDAQRRAPTYSPMLAAATETLPQGEEWGFEPKWDGFRAIAVVEGGQVTLRSRNGNDLSGRFVPAAKALARAVRSPAAVIDGEVCALDDSGTSAFGLLQRGEGTLVFVAFDVLERDGEPVVDRPYDERRAILERLVDASIPGVLVSPSFDDGAALEAAAKEHGLEGVVAKRRASRYQPGRRSSDWRKLKLKHRQELVIAGYTRGKGRRSNGIGSLVLGVHGATGLVYAGNVGTGLTDAELDRLEVALAPLARPDPPFVDTPRIPRARRDDVTWVEPSLVAEVEFAEWTTDGRLRAPVYLGVRDDKPAEEIMAERVPMPTELKRGSRTLRLTNLDKPFWPDEGISKGDLLAFYRDIAPALVPHLRDRPFTMKRYPDGWQGKHFFQKDAPSHMPDWIRRASFPASMRDGGKRMIDYPLVNDELALLWMVNMGCIDMNAWTSRVDLPARPDWVIFDLDPSDDVRFPEVIEVALLVKEILDLVGLESFAKTSGSRGIHVLVPLTRRHGYDETRSFAGIVAGALARAHPSLVTTEWTRSKRRGVLVDANQNGPGRTTATVYSVRPRPGAPVSTPLSWDEVGADLDPAAFTFDEVRARVARHGDLFAPVLERRQSLGAALRSLG